MQIKTLSFFVVSIIMSSTILAVNLRSKDDIISPALYDTSANFDGSKVVYVTDSDNIDECVKETIVHIEKRDCGKYKKWKQGLNYHKGELVTNGLGIFKSLIDNNTSTINVNNVCIIGAECTEKHSQFILMFGCTGGEIDISAAGFGLINLDI
jgi:hypothetical protein